jgi:hypothetical protein
VQPEVSRSAAFRRPQNLIVLFNAVLGPRFFVHLPLHIRGAVLASMLQRFDVIDDVAGQAPVVLPVAGRGAVFRNARLTEALR